MRVAYLAGVACRYLTGFYIGGGGAAVEIDYYLLPLLLYMQHGGWGR